MKDEVSKYINDCYEHERILKFDDIYVTDHTPVEPKYGTAGEDEDQDYFDYQQSLDEYNNEGSNGSGSGTAFGSKYVKGSLLQRIMDPLAYATKDANGTLCYTVT